ncbi:MAG: response regulator [Ginsengibacter sp.]
MINSTPLSLLIIEDNPGDYILLKEQLRQMQLPVKEVVHAMNMEMVPLIIKDNIFDIVLLDLSLPDSNGIDSVITIDRLLPKTPIIVLSGFSSLELATETISLGAQDYLVKGEFDAKLMAKTIQYSIERKRTLENLRLSNERYELINKATLDTTWEYNFETNIGQWGEGFVNTFGYWDENLFFDRDGWQKMIHPDDLARVLKNLNFHFKNHLRNWQDEYRFKAANSTYKDVFTRGYFVYGTDGGVSRIFGAMTDITQRKKLEKELALQQLSQQKLITETTISAQEKERNELGKELHDNINQILASAKIYIGIVRKDRTNAQELLDKSHEYINYAIEEIRKLSKSLVSPSIGDITLQDALKDLVNEVNITNTIKLELNYNVDPGKMIDDKKELMLYRIVQEQINNMLKHSHAKNGLIWMKTEGSDLCLTILDDGVGFNKEEKRKGIGLQNITSRIEFYSGKMIITSSPGQGCKFDIKIPL